MKHGSWNYKETVELPALVLKTLKTDIDIYRGIFESEPQKLEPQSVRFNLLGRHSGFVCPLPTSPLSP